MNEFIFLLHVCVVIGFVLASFRIGNHYALVTWVAIQAILANLFVLKQIVLFGMTVTCSDVFAVGSILTLNLLQEYYGKSQAQLAVKCAFLGLVFFACMSMIHLLYIPSQADNMHPGYQQIFSSTPRIIAASIGVFYLVQKLDIIFFGWLKTVFTKSSFSKRVSISLIVSQFVDTVLFSIFGLYGIVESVGDIIVVSFSVKCLIICLSAPLVALSKRFFHDLHATA